MSFEETFKQIPPEDITGIYTLAGKDAYAITAGKKDCYNSMIGSVADSDYFSESQRRGALSEATVIRLNC